MGVCRYPFTCKNPACVHNPTICHAEKLGTLPDGPFKSTKFAEFLAIISRQEENDRMGIVTPPIDPYSYWREFPLEAIPYFGYEQTYNLLAQRGLEWKLGRSG